MAVFLINALCEYFHKNAQTAYRDLGIFYSGGIQLLLASLRYLEEIRCMKTVLFSLTSRSYMIDTQLKCCCLLFKNCHGDAKKSSVGFWTKIHFAAHNFYKYHVISLIFLYKKSSNY